VDGLPDLLWMVSFAVDQALNFLHGYSQFARRGLDLWQCRPDEPTECCSNRSQVLRQSYYLFYLSAVLVCNDCASHDWHAGLSCSPSILHRLFKRAG
jgi:hypothetical protein